MWLVTLITCGHEHGYITLGIFSDMLKDVARMPKEESKNKKILLKIITHL